MRLTILGFNQAKSVELGLDMTDLLLLDYIQRANGEPSMSHIVQDEVSYVWLSHGKIHEDLPILNISEGTLKNRLSKLKEKNLIMSVQIANKSRRGSRTYYSIAEMTTSLENDVEERPRHSKMTSDNLLTIDSKLSNNNISKDILLGDFEDKLYSNEKPKKQKKKNLYEKCLDYIYEKTDDLELQDLLVTFLKMRLEVKDKPLYTNMWRGMVNKLFTMSDKIAVLCDIVQQSIDKGWLSFYALKQYSDKKRNVQSVSSEFGEVRCDKIEDEEMVEDEYF